MQIFIELAISGARSDLPVFERVREPLGTAGATLAPTLTLTPTLALTLTLIRTLTPTPTPTLTLTLTLTAVKAASSDVQLLQAQCRALESAIAGSKTETRRLLVG